MRQRITIDNLNQLTPEQKERLREWWKPQIGDLYTNLYAIFGIYSSKDYNKTSQLLRRGNIYKINALPLLNIGQCIELLFYHPSRKYYGGALIMYLSKYGSSIYGNDMSFEAGVSVAEKDELIDALWSAVKEAL